MKIINKERKKQINQLEIALSKKNQKLNLHQGKKLKKK
jgi:hypothetical protein